MRALDATRVWAVVHKELRDYRRRRSIVVTMLVLPCLFLINPVLTVFFTPASTASSTLDKTISISLIFFLIIPVIMPSALAAYSAVADRGQGGSDHASHGGAVLRDLRALPRCHTAIRQSHRRLGIVSPGPDPASPLTVHSAIGRMGNRGRNGDLG